MRRACRPSSLAQSLALAPLLAVFCACRTAPTQAIPDPLPETLEWTRADRTGGEPNDAYLGIEVRENHSGSLESLAFDPGVRVTRVAPDSPAAAAGVQVGDVLLAWNETPVDDPGTLAALLSDGPGAAELRVRRGDSVFEFEVGLTGREQPLSFQPPRLAWRSDPARSRAGWLAGRGGVVLVTSDPEGPFPRAGVEVGSVVMALDGESVRSERSLIRRMQALDPGAKVRVTYRPAGEGEQEREVEVKLFDAPTRVIEASLPILAGYHGSVDGSESRFYLIDLWIISLFKYRREGQERHYSFLRFIEFSSGVGVLSE